MMLSPPDPLVHLELHTGDLPRACAFYGQLFGWPAEVIEAGSRPYTGLGPGRGVVSCPTPRPLWLPYVEVGEIGEATDRARRLGAAVLLDPGAAPAGWRSVVRGGAGGEIAFWQPKR